MKTIRSLASIALLCAASAASAHDYWMEPVVAPDGSASLRLFVGECLKPEEEKHQESARSSRFAVFAPDGSSADLGASTKDDAQPVAKLPVPDAQHLVVLDRNAAYVELEASKFEAYLKESGLGAISEERRSKGDGAKPGRERYLRFLKTLVPGGTDDSDNPVSTQTVSQTLELVPMENLGEITAGERLHMRVLLEGRPLQGAKVDLCTRAANGRVSRLSDVSNQYGDAAFSVPAQGLTLVRTVTMRPVTDGDEKADWESLWTSYSFIVRKAH